MIRDTLGSSEKKFTNIDCSTLEEKLKDDRNAVVLDVRTPQEFKLGAISGAINIDIYSPDFSSRIEELDKNREYYVYCQAGSRSATACNILTSAGFKEVYNLSGGISLYKGRKSIPV